MPSRRSWANWSDSARCVPARWVAPTSEAELAAAVRAAVRSGHRVRAAGTGHSFNRLVCTTETLLDLSRFDRVLRIDRAAPSITVAAGTPLWKIIAALDRAGLALANLGSLTRQTIAGAISTGTHGTGLGRPSLAAQVIALRLVTADGRILDSGPGGDRSGQELLRCARTSLGALGVISTVTLRCVPAFNLRAALAREPLDRVLDGFEEWAASSDRPSLSWTPWSEHVVLRSVDPTGRPPTRGAFLRGHLSALGEVGCAGAGGIGRWAPRTVPWLAERIPGSSREYVDGGHRVLSFPQPVRFIAMEYALPLEAVPSALRQLRTTLRGLDRFSPFPIAVRVGAGDDLPLSPAYGRTSGFINLTVPRARPYARILTEGERILWDMGGRPHWGKAHTATASMLAPRYPEWPRFQEIRARVDPEGVFTSDYLATILGPVTRAEPFPQPVSSA